MLIFVILILITMVGDRQDSLDQPQFAERHISSYGRPRAGVCHVCLTTGVLHSPTGGWMDALPLPRALPRLQCVSGVLEEDERVERRLWHPKPRASIKSRRATWGNPGWLG